MRRIIPIEINNEYVIGGGVVVGAAGSHDDVVLQITFSPMWAGLAKSIVWLDADELNPVATLLTADLLEVGSTTTYNVPIPAAPKAKPGRMTMAVKGVAVSDDGSTEDRATLAAAAEFIVLESKWTDDAGNDLPIEPSTAEQLQGQIDKVLEDIAAAASGAQVATEKAAEAAASAADAEAAKAAAEANAAAVASAKEEVTSAVGTVENAASRAENAATRAEDARAAAENAKNAANAAADAGNTSAAAAAKSAAEAKGAAETAAAEVKDATAADAAAAAQAAREAAADAEVASAAAAGAAAAAARAAVSEGEAADSAGEAKAAEAAAKRYAEQAQEVAGGDFATPAQVNAAVEDHNTDAAAHEDLRELIRNKQEKLTFDTAPTEGSTNPVTSGGVKKAIDDIPTPDVSGQINKHNTDAAAHDDIRQTAAAAKSAADNHAAQQDNPHKVTAAQAGADPAGTAAAAVQEHEKKTNPHGITPAGIGAAPANHTQGAGTITAGTLAGQVVANAAAVAVLGTAQVRNIYITDTDLEAGVTALPSGDICFVIE